MGTVHSPQNWQVPVALASVFLGILVSVQFRVQKANRITDPKDWARYAKQLEGDNRKLSQELTATRDRLLLAEKGREGDSIMSKELSEARIRAGLVAMKGPGTMIILTDSQRRPGPAEDPYSFIVHDVDLLALVNELWAAGAEAVSVNDQRIVNRTAIRCVGPAILVNNIQLASPFMVRAIGKSADMEGGMRMPGGFLDSMGLLIRSGGEVRVTQSKEVTVPAFEGPMTYRFAVPAEAPSPTSQGQPSRTAGGVSQAAQVRYSFRGIRPAHSQDMGLAKT